MLPNGIHSPVRTVTALAACLVLLAGCQSGQRQVNRPHSAELAMAGVGDQFSLLDYTTHDLTPLTPHPEVKARVAPPVGWTPDPLKASDRHTHQVWLSPTGNTAYGVSHFSHFLLFLASEDRVLTEVLKGMKDTSGETQLLSSQRDRDLGGTRFVADAGPYLVRGNLIRQGRDGWVIYAGTVRGKPIESDELRIAEEARERTEVGLE